MGQMNVSSIAVDVRTEIHQVNAVNSDCLKFRV